ncbi:hypothetical protein [Actinoplanes solisilvae]|uniref:hypothetical protein n=1 Tax=Actinoplanes solisilvae TaxID=2486853 RepID=UPI0013E2DC1A|nr:hypothetical protein [Actinoplanes solisilvae]
MQEQMCSAGGDLLGVIGLGVQGVGDEHDPGQAAQYFSTASSSGVKAVISLLSC